MADVIPADQREHFLAENIKRLMDGVTYATHYGNGRAQLTLDEDAGQAFVKLRVLVELEREERDR